MLIQRILRITLGGIILLTLLIDTFGIIKYPFLNQLENWTYDARLNYKRLNTIDDRIVIVDIDESSLALEGRWPWSRDKLAVIVNNLFEVYQADVVGFDIVFAEKDESSGLKEFEFLASTELKDDPLFHKALDNIRPSLEYDQMFAKALKDRNVVMGYYFKSNVSENEIAQSGLLPTAVTKLNKQLSARLPINKALGYGGNLNILQSSARSGGFFDNPFVDSDGVFRRVPLIQIHQDQVYASLALSTTQAYLKNSDIKLNVVNNGTKNDQYYALESVHINEFSIPVDGKGAVYVPFRGLSYSFPYISAHKILNKKIDPDSLKGKIVLVGTTAPGLLDLRSTPVQSVYPGVEIHANIISGILDQRINHSPAWAIGYEFIILILIAATMAFLLPVSSPLMATVATTIVLILTVSGTLMAWNSQIILPLASPVLLIVLNYILHMSYGFFIESRGKRQLAHLFGQYIPPEIVDEMSKSPANFSLDGENKVMTVLFSDVRGFTTISEGMDPKQLTQLMNALLTPMTRVIHKHRGTIDKYMGDAIMSFWGAPLEDPDHARHALHAAMEMMVELKIMQKDFESRGWPPINIGIGLNTGNMNVGNMGSEFRMAYTVLGDSVNLGARLEGLTKEYGVNIIVSESTKESIPEFTYRDLDLVRVKGKNEPIAIFEPIGHEDEIDEATTLELARYNQALQSFRAQNWDQAETDFFALSQIHPDRFLYQVYLNRVTHYKGHLPNDDWDGVFTHTSK
jgi:adenylate cyclase